MIIKGSSRGGSQLDVDRLARHLVARENETVVVMEGCDGHADLARALTEMRAVTLGTRSRRALYHASLSLSAAEAYDLADPKWIEAVDVLERHLEMGGHQRVVVGHTKKGRRHVHVVWCRAHPLTLKIASDSQSYRKHEACSRELEERWKSRPVVGVHTRPEGTPRPVAKATHQDWQAQTRTGVQVDDVAAIMKQAWDSTTTGRAFRKAIEAEGLHLAAGRRGIVVVDQAGTPHSIPRRLGDGIRAADVQRRLKDIDVAALPMLEAVQKATRAKNKPDTNRREQMSKTAFGCQQGRRQKTVPTFLPEHRDYWIGLGYEVERSAEGWLVKLSATTTLVDAGDVLTLHRVGEPSDDEIMAMITAGKARGWTSIRFFGGSESFQQRARVLAVKSGNYTWDDVSLECEEGRPKPLAAEMPKHVRDRLLPPVEPEPPSAPLPPIHDVPPPTPELRP